VPTHPDLQLEPDAFAACNVDVNVIHARPTWRAPTVAAVVAAIAFAAIAQVDTTDITAPGAVAYGPAASHPGVGVATEDVAAGEGRVETLQTRFVGHATIEIWGRTTANDGSAIRLRLEPPGASPVRLPEVPAIAGRFYAKAPLPANMRGRDVNVRASVVP
jgi:anti-sigma-K factor RskA